MDKFRTGSRVEPIPSILKKPKTQKKGDLLDKSSKIKREKHSSKKSDVNLPLPQGCTPLMYACQQADYNSLVEIINRDPSSVRVRDRGLRCALHYCASSGSGANQSARAACADRVLMAAPALADARDADGLTPLHLAVVHGNVPLVQTLLAAGADVNAKDDESHTVVHWATVGMLKGVSGATVLSGRQGRVLELLARGNLGLRTFILRIEKVEIDDITRGAELRVCGEVGALRAVLAAGADAATPDQHGGYPLHYAAQMCGAPSATDHQSRGAALEVLRALIKEGNARVDVRDADGRTPLLWAASAGSAAAVLALHQAGARVDDSDRDGLTALHCAAARGHTEALETLVGLCGARVDVADTHGCTPLHYAAALGHADATSALLEHGADAHRQDRRGRSPAHTAAAKGQIETVRILGAKGAQLWLRNSKGDLPLHEAVASGRRELVKWLLDGRPSQVNATNHEGRTPLHIAAATDNADLCRLLLDRGAEVNSVARSSKNELITPLDCATMRGHRSTAKYLQMHGGLPASKLPNTQIIIDNATITSLPTRRITSTKIDLRDKIRIEKREVVELSSPIQERRRIRDASDLNSDSSEDYKKSKKRYGHKYSERKKRLLDSKQKSFSDGYDTELEACCVRDHKQKVRRRSRSRKSRSKSEPSNKSKKSPRSHRKYRSTSESSSEMSSSQEKIKSKRHKKRNKRRTNSTSDSSTESSERRSTKRKGKKTSIHIENDDLKQSVAIIKYKNPDSIKSDGTKENMERSVSFDAASVLKKNENELDQSMTNKTQSETETDTLSVKTNMIVTEAQIHMERESNQNGSSELTVTVDALNNVSIEASNMSISQMDSKEEPSEIKEDEEAKIDSIDSRKETHLEKLTGEVDPDIQTSETLPVDLPLPATYQADPSESLPKIDQEGIKVFEKESKDTSPTGSGELQISEKSQSKSFQVLSGPDKTSSLSKDPSEKSSASLTDTKNEQTISQEKSSPTVSFSNKDEVFKIKENAATDDSMDRSEKNTLDKRENIEEKCITEDVLTHSKAGEPVKGVDKGILSIIKDDSTEHVMKKIQSPSEFDDVEMNLSLPDTSPKLNRKQLRDSQTSSRKSSIYETESYKVLSETGGELETSSGILKKHSTIDDSYFDEDNGDFNKKNTRQSSYGRVPSVSDNEICYISEANGKRKRFRKKGRSRSRITIRSKSENSERGYESSGVMDSGFEPSPRPIQRCIISPRLNAYYEQRKSGKLLGKCDSKIPIRKPGDKNAVDMRSVTQRIQTNMRRYYCERKIFQHLLELKRLQIRTSKANEAVLVKRAIDEYNKSSLAHVGLGSYNNTDYSFSSFEKFLYHSLRKLQKSGKKHLDNLPEKPIDFDYGESELYKMRSIPDNPCLCTSKTHRCFHAIHAYTGIPCAAYIPYKWNHHTMPKPSTAGARTKSKNFLPKIHSKPSSSSGKAHVTLEVSHGTEKQLIALPAERLDKNKRYYVAFTVKGSEPTSDNDNASTVSAKAKNLRSD